jgi:hypothetical protein
VRSEQISTSLSSRLLAQSASRRALGTPAFPETVMRSPLFTSRTASAADTTFAR